MALVPLQIFAIPKAIEQIIRTFEGKNSKKQQTGSSSTLADPSSKPKEKKDTPPPLPPDTAALNDEHTTATSPTEQDTTTEKGTTHKDGGEKNTETDREETNKDSTPTISNAEQAQLAIDEAIKDRKLVTHPATWYYRGVIYHKLLKTHITSEKAATLLDETLASYTKTTELCPPNTQFHSFAQSNIASLWSYYLDRGIRYHKQENFDQAVAQFAICQRILPKDPTPVLYTAIVYHSNNQAEEALQNYETYLQATEPQVAIFRAMANIQYFQLQKFDEAISLLNKAITQFPYHNELLEEKFLIYKAANQIALYETALLEAISALEADHTMYEYAYLQENQGLIERAIPYYECILAKMPNHYNTLRQLGFICYNETIKTHAHAPQVEKQKEETETDAIYDFNKLIYVTAKYQLNTPFIHTLYPIAPNMIPLLNQSIDHAERRFFVNSKFLIHNYQSANNGWGLSMSDLIKSGNIPNTSLIYWHTTKRIAAELLRSGQKQTISKLEKYLKDALHYLQKAHKQDKKDKDVANALYYIYVYLKKYGSANRLSRAMERRKQSIGDDPFYIENRDNT